MFIPKKIIKKKKHRAHLLPKITKFIEFPHVKSGVIALKTINFGFIFATQLDSFYQTLNKILKKKAKILIYTYPTGHFTTKPDGARMGKGKGKKITTWVCKICAGFIICEIHTRFFLLAIAALKVVKKKLPISSRICLNY